MTSPERGTEFPGWEPTNDDALEHHVPRLMNDVYEEPGLPAVSLAEGTDFQYFSDSSTAAFRLHSLTFLNTLTETYRDSGDIAYAKKAREIALRWLNTRGTPDDSPAWHGHATALRTGMLSYLCSAGFTPEDDVKVALREHADHLAREENYEGAWNHGLDQNIALLRASRALREPGYADIASVRLEEAATQYVDEQGVVSEQAPHYAVYVHKLLGVAIDELTKSGLPISAALRRRDRIPAFLTWATRPDGHVVQVGDSLLRQPPDDIAADLEVHSATSASLTSPASRHMVYDDGWAFIRSGWGETRPAIEESHLTVRYGTFRRIHGHRDHTSILWFAGGRPILEDPGFSGYGDKAVREYEQGESSHSVVSLTGAGSYAWSRGTDLRQHSTVAGLLPSDELHLMHLAGAPYKGVNRTRSIAYWPALDVLLVRDAIAASSVIRAHQTWQFGASFDTADFSDDRQSAVLEDTRGKVFIRQYLATDEAISHRGSVEPMAGWSPTLESRRTPSWSLRWAKRGQNVGYFTSITSREDLRVELGSGGRILVHLSERDPSPLTGLRFEPDVGFQPISLPATGRWNHAG